MRGYTQDVNVKGTREIEEERGPFCKCSTLKLKKVIYLVTRLSRLPSDVEYNKDFDTAYYLNLPLKASYLFYSVES